MAHTYLSRFLCLLILCCALPAVSQVSRHAFEAVATETVSVELEDGQQLQGQLRHVDDTRAVLLSADGEVHEVPLRNVAHLRVVSSTPRTHTSSTADAGDTPEDEMTVAERAQHRVEQSVAQANRTQKDAYLKESSGGYLTPEDDAADNPFSGAPQAHQYQDHRQELTLSALDYAQYNDMMDRSRMNRAVGWSLFATGLSFLALTARQAYYARAYGYNADVGALAIVGTLTTLSGLPIAIAGRQQYKQAADFAEKAARSRAAIRSNDSSSE